MVSKPANHHTIAVTLAVFLHDFMRHFCSIPEHNKWSRTPFLWICSLMMWHSYPLWFRPQAHYDLRIPKEHHRFIIGREGAKLHSIEMSTATKISVPRSNDPSEVVKIMGTKEGVDKARHQIQIISDEQVILCIKGTYLLRSRGFLLIHKGYLGCENENKNEVQLQIIGMFRPCKQWKYTRSTIFVVFCSCKWSSVVWLVMWSDHANAELFVVCVCTSCVCTRPLVKNSTQSEVIYHTQGFWLNVWHAL